jgi:voltage-gated sodium channel
MLITFCYCVWVGIDVDRYPHGTSLYQKDASSIAVEFFFYTFFLGELIVRLMVSASLRECLRDVWIGVDMLCVLGSLVDVVFVPVASGDHTESEIAVFRVMRLLKIVRVVRFSRASGEVKIFLTGLWYGLCQSFIVWAILFGAVYIYSMLLRTYATDEVVEKYFSSLPLSMNCLVVSGILLDGVEDVLNGMIRSSDAMSYIAFLLFVFFSQFIVLNMLIGVITSVAGEVRMAENAFAKEKYLRRTLESIVECYVGDDGMLSRRQFRLVTKNADVQPILEQCGTDAGRLIEIEGSLYEKSDHLGCHSLYSAIARLNEAKPATASDVFYTQDVLHRTLHSIEFQLAAAGFHGLREQQCHR